MLDLVNYMKRINSMSFPELMEEAYRLIARVGLIANNFFELKKEQILQIIKSLFVMDESFIACNQP